jgi:hypothetical protein
VGGQAFTSANDREANVVLISKLDGFLDILDRFGSEAIIGTCLALGSFLRRNPR